MMHIDDSSSVILRLEQVIEKLDESGAMKRAKFVPISLSPSVKIEKALKSKGKMDSIWVGLSVSHHIEESLSRITADDGSGELFFFVEDPSYSSQNKSKI